MKLFLLSFFLASLQVGYAQSVQNRLLPSDPAVKISKLANGLTYYIRENKIPANKVELRLIINAGSIVEDDDQLGLAHFLEHMAFNGTKNFEKNELVSFLQEIGVSFGHDVNAFTYFNHTDYILPIPTDKPGNLEKGFQILEDWAHNITLHDEDIDEERAVVLEEDRVKRGANERVWKKAGPLFFNESRYATRDPIGTEASIKNFKSDALRRFYKEWYRPELMTVIVVGDISTERAEYLIRKHFSALINPPGARKRIDYPLPPYKENLAGVYTDDEERSYTINLVSSAIPAKRSQYEADFNESFLRDQFSTLLSIRLHEIVERGHTPLSTMSINYDRPGGYLKVIASAAVTQPQNVQAGLDILLGEIRKALKFGFKDYEWERLKKKLATGNEKANNELGNTDSRTYAEMLMSCALSGNTCVSLDWIYNHFKSSLSAVSVEDINKAGRTLLHDDLKFFVYVTGPESKLLPSEKKLMATLKKTPRNLDDSYERAVVEFTPNIITSAPANLLDYSPLPGSIVSESENKLIDTKIWKLSNGAIVFVKKTDFKSDEIMFGASRLGGTSKYGAKDRYNYEYLLKLTDVMGWGKYTSLDLQKVLAGKIAMAAPFLTDVLEGFMGYSGVQDLETLLQLVHLKATSPNFNPYTFAGIIAKSKIESETALASPETIFLDTLYKTFYNHNVFAPSVASHPSDFDQINLSRAREIYYERFAAMNGMQFVFVGNIDEQVLKPLVEKYLAGLPSGDKPGGFRDNGLRPVKGQRTLNVYKGKADKSMIVSLFTDSIAYNDTLAMNMHALSEILEMRILNVIREKLQSTYNAGTAFEFEKIPYPNYLLSINIPTGPEKVDLILNALDSEINALKNEGPGDAELNKIKQQWTERYKRAVKENAYWMQYLVMTRLTGESFDYFLNKEKYINEMTTQSVQSAAKTIFSSGNRFTAILRPAKK